VTKVTDEMGNGTAVPEGTSGEGRKASARRLGIKEFIITLVIIFLVWAAQKCYSGDRLTGSPLPPHQLSVKVVSMPGYTR
jgi:hypothetical protein